MTTAGVEFEEDSFNRPTTSSGGGGAPSFGGSQPSYQYANAGYGNSGEDVRGMAGWLMRHGLAKSPAGAQVILIGVVIINIIITIVALTFYL